jgi:ABC-type polysaccharide/polyol phosphate transport system ATPase subunit
MKRFVDEGRTVVFVSHSAATVAQTCNRVCVLKDGRKVFDGPTLDGLAVYEALG